MAPEPTTGSLPRRSCSQPSRALPRSDNTCRRHCRMSPECPPAARWCRPRRRTQRAPAQHRHQFHRDEVVACPRRRQHLEWSIERDVVVGARRNHRARAVQQVEINRRRVDVRVSRRLLEVVRLVELHHQRNVRISGGDRQLEQRPPLGLKFSNVPVPIPVTVPLALRQLER